MARKGEGCQWEQKGFSVFMHPSKEEKCPCSNCTNNKYYGGSEEICDACRKYNNFKERRR